MAGVKGGTRAGLIGGLAALLIAALLATPPMQWLDAWAYDWLLRVRHAARAGPQAPTDLPIRIVGIDEDAATQFRHRSPLPRGYLSKVLRKLSEAEPRLIVLDVLLDRPSYPEEDATLAQAIRQAGNVVLPHPASAFTAGGPCGILPQFRDGALAIGAVDVQLDRDNVLRRMRPLVPTESGSAPFVATVGARLLGVEPVPHHDRTLLINFAGPPGRTFPTVRSEQLLSSDVDPAILRGAVVFVGSMLEDGGDIVATPLSTSLDPASGQHAPTSGAEALANCLLTLLTRPVREFRWLLRATVSVIVGGLAAALVTWLTFSAIARPWLRLLAWPTAVIGLELAGGLVWMGLFLREWTFCGLAPLAAVGVGPVAAAADMARREYARRRRAAAELQMRDELTATIVHDLKNPLAVIGMSAKMLGREAAEQEWPDQAGELLEMLDEQTRRLSREIESLLDADPRRPITAVRRPVDLRQLAEELVQSQQLYASRHEFSVGVPRGFGEVYVDKALITRALSNLLENAVRYSPEGGMVELHVEEEDDRVRISISDEGIGMTRADRARLFRPFSRVVDDSYGIKGTGVGLFSVKRIAEAHGGSVGVESELGKGSLFWVEIPMNVGAGDEEG